MGFLMRIVLLSVFIMKMCAEVRLAENISKIEFV